jgi:CubicO group peptidase (beta-lactamase class C family)
MDEELLKDLNSEVIKLLDMGYDIHTILVIKDGYIVAEQYYSKYFKKDIEHRIHSCTKSFTSACVGIAIDQGYINGIEDKMYEYFPEYEIANLTEEKRSITIEHLLTMSAGLDWNELDTYYSDPQNAFYQWRRADDRVKFLLDRSMEHSPGSTHDYNSGLSDLLSIIVEKQTGMRADSFAAVNLLTPIGIDEYYWAIDSKDGHAIGYGQMRLIPRDMARFGYLYLKEGKWDGTQIIPGSWAEESGKQQIAAGHDPGANYYGYQFWVTDYGMYTAMGYSGQWIMVLPDYDLVVVFTNNFEEGNGEQWQTPVRLLNEYIIPAVIE